MWGQLPPHRPTALTDDTPRPENAALPYGVAQVSKFIQERIVLVRSLAEKADPFIKPRLLALAARYERQLSSAGPSQAVREIRKAAILPAQVLSER